MSDLSPLAGLRGKNLVQLEQRPGHPQGMGEDKAPSPLTELSAHQLGGLAFHPSGFDAQASAAPCSSLTTPWSEVCVQPCLCCCFLVTLPWIAFKSCCLGVLTVVFACVLMSDLTCALWAAAKDKAWLLARQHDHDCWDVRVPCSVLASDWCGVLNTVSGLPAVCLNKVL